MGLKKRVFAGTMKSAIMAALRESDGMTRRELLVSLRNRRSLNVSVKRVGTALTGLVSSGRVVMEGHRHHAKFRDARAR